MYKIDRLINNNIVSSRDEKGREVILRGLGIGFGKKRNDFVDEDKIEKIYRISGHSELSKLESMLSDFPQDCITLVQNIVSYAKEILPQKLSDSIYLSLTDHINFALQRKDQHFLYPNPLLQEIKQFYPTEYKIGLRGLDMVEQQYGIRLTEDEAGFMALHIVNAELHTDMGNTVMITEFLQACIEIIQEYYKHEIDENTYDFQRLVTHLKYLGQRLFSQKNQKIMDDKPLQEIIQTRYPAEYKCAEHIHEYVIKKYKKDFGEEEKMYLTIHLRRIIITTYS